MILDDLGVRICIMGPSSSGKSTLATAIGLAKDLSIVHLDQYRHHPRTQWELRSAEEFAELHAAAVSRDRWVIDGNYSKLLDGRLARATGLILLDAGAAASLARYLRRTLGTRARLGGLDGAKDRVTWEMVRYILGPTQTNRREYRDRFDAFTLPKVFIPNRMELDRLYRQAGLERG